MDKLDERDPATRSSLAAAPALAVQFFLIPLAVVAVTVGVYAGFRSLLADDRSAKDYLAEIRNGGSDRRWPAAYELSRLMSNPKVRADKTLAPALVKAFLESQKDPDVRRYFPDGVRTLDETREELEWFRHGHPHHPELGLWHAYRGALAFAERLALAPVEPVASPCDDCAGKPCLAACPVGAFAASRYDVARPCLHRFPAGQSGAISTGSTMRRMSSLLV